MSRGATMDGPQAGADFDSKVRRYWRLTIASPLGAFVVYAGVGVWLPLLEMLIEAPTYGVHFVHLRFSTGAYTARDGVLFAIIGVIAVVFMYVGPCYRSHLYRWPIPPIIGDDGDIRMRLCTLIDVGFLAAGLLMLTLLFVPLVTHGRSGSVRTYALLAALLTAVGIVWAFWLERRGRALGLFGDAAAHALVLPAPIVVGLQVHITADARAWHVDTPGLPSYAAQYCVVLSGLAILVGLLWASWRMAGPPWVACRRIVEEYERGKRKKRQADDDSTS